MTMLELIVSVLLMTIVVLVAVRLFSNFAHYFRRTTVRNELLMDSRRCLNTMKRFLRQGKANTVQIRTPAGSPPNSQIDFQLFSSSTSYEFRWVDNTVQMKVGTLDPLTLGMHVTGLMFTGDSSDPASLLVTLRMDATSSPQHTETVLLPNQRVHMLGSPY